MIKYLSALHKVCHGFGLGFFKSRFWNFALAQLKSDLKRF